LFKRLTQKSTTARTEALGDVSVAPAKTAKLALSTIQRCPCTAVVKKFPWKIPVSATWLIRNAAKSNQLLLVTHRSTPKNFIEARRQVSELCEHPKVKKIITSLAVETTRTPIIC